MSTNWIPKLKSGDVVIVHKPGVKSLRSWGAVLDDGEMPDQTHTGTVAESEE
jgi:hypothetical protein